MLAPPFTSERSALRAAQRVYKGATEDLLDELPDGRWTFDHNDLLALADIESDYYTVSEIMNEPTQSVEYVEDGPEFADVPELEGWETRTASVSGLTTPIERVSRPKNELREAEKAQKRGARAAARAERIAQVETNAQARLDKRAARRAEAEAKAAARDARREQREEDHRLTQERKVESARLRAEATEKRRAERVAQGQNGVVAPATGTKLATLWSIIDSLREGSDTFPTFRDYKAVAMQLSHDDVGSPGTITTGYYNYRIYHGIKGRVTNAE